MGQAKKRGTFEQRQSEAYDRIDKATEGMSENLAKLEALEKQSEEHVKAVATQMVTSFLREQDNRRLRSMGIRIGADGS